MIIIEFLFFIFQVRLSLCLKFRAKAYFCRFLLLWPNFYCYCFLGKILNCLLLWRPTQNDPLMFAAPFSLRKRCAHSDYMYWLEVDLASKTQRCNWDYNLIHWLMRTALSFDPSSIHCKPWKFAQLKKFNAVCCRKLSSSVELEQIKLAQLPSWADLIDSIQTEEESLRQQTALSELPVNC